LSSGTLGVTSHAITSSAFLFASGGRVLFCLVYGGMSTSHCGDGILPGADPLEPMNEETNIKTRRRKEATR